MCNSVKVLDFQKLELKLKEMSTGFSTRVVEIGIGKLEIGNWNVEIGIWNLGFGIWDSNSQIPNSHPPFDNKNHVRHPAANAVTITGTD
jgi:hypothetical protein